MKKIIILIFLFLINVIPSFANVEIKKLPSITGLVKSIEYVDIQDESASVKQLAEIEILEGELKNQTLILDNMLTGNPFYDIKLSKGMKILLHVEETDGELSFAIEDIKRSNILLTLSIIFCGLLIYVGRKKGIFSLIAIIITCILIFNLLSPMILFGINPIIATLLICLLSTALTMFLVGGFNRKSSAATLGCLLSLIFAGILAFLTVKLAHLNGLNGENSLFLYSTHPELSFTSLIISTIILATLGAVMDVGMSIASTINEIYEIDNTKSVKELFTSGMNVGKDIIGTMANTLILVYLGSSLPLILLTSNIDIQRFLNLNQIVTEISSAIIGSIAIVICVPITAFIASELIKNMPEKIDFKNLKNNCN